MTKLVAVTALSAALSVALLPKAKATLYDVEFTGGGSSASGQIDVVGGVAVSGSLDITAGPAQGVYSLYTWNGGGTSSVRIDGGTDLIVDNIVVNSSPFFTGDGLAFISSAYTGGLPSEGMVLSLNGSVDNLIGFGVDGYGNPNANGIVTMDLTPVPEPSTIISGACMLLPFGAVAGRQIFRRRRTVS
jgi:hypothetical protein